MSKQKIIQERPLLLNSTGLYITNYSWRHAYMILGLPFPYVLSDRHAPMLFLIPFSMALSVRARSFQILF